MSPLAQALIYATIAGATIPLGGLLARIEHIRPRWLEQELRHTVLAFGGGILLAAVSLVLIPQGKEMLPLPGVVTAFVAGGLAFMAVDRWLARSGRAASQLVAMLVDFLPEAMALGAMLATGNNAGVLLALLIALQNLPESFNAYRELTRSAGMAPGRVFRAFLLVVLLGPVAAFAGHQLFSEQPEVLGAVMLFASGGILYLTFQDLAPQVRLERHWAPPLGAVAGFALALAGDMLIH